MSKLPETFTSNNSMACYILLVPIYSFFFLIGYKPFNIISNLNVEMGRFAFYASMLISILLVVVMISRFAMRLLRDRLNLTYSSFFIWEFFEVFTASMFFTLFIWLITGRKTPYVSILPNVSLISFFVLIFPYTILALISELSHKSSIVEKLQNNIDRYANGIIGADKSPIHFLDENKAMKLVVTAESLLYIVASDNYVDIHYLSNGRITKYSLRNTMRSIEELCMQNNLLRCHRSYIVNLKKVKIIQKDKTEGLFAELDTTGSPHIPISKKYADQVIKAFSMLND
ncbi:MAG: LytTR family transcriptional regulator [Bacteroidaceae bacterium]|nr:LytTR family transcriptional regulator [Bacteroidaceae bacterium]